jgi:hypothetical protein
MTMPTTTFASGLRVANFSSPHSFRFTDGSELAACTAERANLSKLNAEEIEIPREGWVDIRLSFRLNVTILSMLKEAYDLWDRGEVDVIITPFPVISAMKESPDLLGFDPNDPEAHPFRTIRTADRVTKVNHSDRFCI